MKSKQILIAVLVLLLLAGVVGTSASPLAASGASSQAVGVLPAWQQVNTSGFGDPTTDEITALEAFNGYLYAGTHNPIDTPPGTFDGTQIFRSSDGVNWTSVIDPGFGNTHDTAPTAILDFTVFNAYLYAGTGWRNASQVWRSSNGTIWAPMDVTGFSDPDNVDVTALVAYNGKIYAGLRNSVTGARLYSSFTGDNNTWTPMIAPALADSLITGFAEFAGGLYAAVESPSPAQVWLSYGSAWTAEVDNGFGDSKTLSTGGLAVFAGDLYVGAGNDTTGAQLWRTSDGTVWTQVITPVAFGDANNQKVESVFVYQNQLYLGVKNTATGLQVWRSPDGTSWSRANLDGFDGSNHNTSTNLGNAIAKFGCQLYVGTLNTTDGGELWRMGAPCLRLHLPLVLRGP